MTERQPSPPIKPRRRSWLCLAALITGCGAGELAWPTGNDTLRTALYTTQLIEGVEKTTIILSNGIFECDFPAKDDPAAQTEALARLITAACRENARHVALTLYRHPAAPNRLGAYIGSQSASASLTDESRPKIASADYFGVNEVVLTSADGFLRTYTATDVDVLRGLGPSGSVTLTNERELLAGQFSFPTGPISGRFRAARCEPDADLFAVLALSPLLVCP